MSTPSENESWIIDAGDEVIHKKANFGVAALSQRDRLVYCLWVADYGMNNAGDLSQAHLLHPNWQQEATQMAANLSLEFTRESFSLPQAILQQQYFERFERICSEIRQACSRFQNDRKSWVVPERGEGAGCLPRSGSCPR